MRENSENDSEKELEKCVHNIDFDKKLMNINLLYFNCEIVVALCWEIFELCFLFSIRRKHSLVYVQNYHRISTHIAAESKNEIK